MALTTSHSMSLESSSKIFYQQIILRKHSSFLMTNSSLIQSRPYLTKKKASLTKWWYTSTSTGSRLWSDNASKSTLRTTLSTILKPWMTGKEFTMLKSNAWATTIKNKNSRWAHLRSSINSGTSNMTWLIKPWPRTFFSSTKTHFNPGQNHLSWTSK